MKYTIFLTVLYGFFRVIYASNTSRVAEESRLIANLLEGYDTNARPISSSEPLHLALDISLAQILNLNEKLQAIKTSVWTRQYWTDVSLMWNPANFSNITSVSLSATRIWKPDLTLKNSMEESDDTYTKIYQVTVNYKGEVAWLAPHIFWTSCILDVSAFPWDIQTCVFEFESWVFDRSKLDLTSKSQKLDISGYVPHGGWTLIKTGVVKRAAYSSCCEEPFSNLLYYVTLQRKALYFEINIIYPTAWIAGSAMLMFLVPAESGEKLSLAITLFLSSMVFLTAVLDILPIQSETVPLIGIFFLILITIMALGTAGATIIVYIHFLGTNNRPVPKCIHMVTLHWLAKVLYCCHACKAGNCPWKLKKRTAEQTNNWNSDGVTVLSVKPTATRIHLSENNDSDVHLSRGVGKTNHTGTSVATQNTSITEVSTCKCNVEDPDTSKEWPMVAKVMNRLFFIMYTVAFISTFIFLYVGKCLSLQSVDEGEEQWSEA